MDVSIPPHQMPPVTTLRPYPWIADYDFAVGEPGEQVLGIDRIDCEKDMAFLVGTIDTLESGALGTGEVAAADRSLQVRRKSMFAANNYRGQSGSPTDRELVDASFNNENYWCIPKREFCYENVAFGDFGIDARSDEIATFKQPNVTSLRNGLLMALQKAVIDLCL